MQVESKLNVHGGGAGTAQWLDNLVGFPLGDGYPHHIRDLLK